MDEIERLVHAYRSKGVLVDSNLLLLYFIGLWDPAQISNFKRTASFTTDDFYLLAKLLHFFQSVVTTPNILTEVNGLSNQLPEHAKEAYYSTFRGQISLLDEHYVSSSSAASARSFLRFGLTDSVIEHLTHNRYLVLSDDLRLTVHLQTIGVDVLNFNHIRFLNWK